MKLLTVDAYQVALISKRGKIVDVFTEGKYWIGFGKTIKLYDMTVPLTEVKELSVLLENPVLREMLHVETITDYELGIELKDGLFSKLYTSGRIAYWDSPVDYSLIKADISNVEVSDAISRKILMKPVVAQHLKAYTVESYQKGILYIDGVFQKVLESGLYFYWKSDKLTSVETIDMRMQSMEILGQEILTKDKVGIRVNFQSQYQVADIEKALKESKDYQKQLYIILQIATREYVGSMTIDQLLSNKEKIGAYIVGESKDAAAVLGVEVISGGIKDIILPGDVKEIMNQVLIAQKKAQANTIMRQEETASTRSLLNTAKLMDDNSMLLKLKEMEYMEKIADKVGEISINGRGRVMDQLNDLLITAKS